MKHVHNLVPPALEQILIAPGALVAVLGLAVLAAWYTENVRFIEFPPHSTPMMPIIAVSFLCLGSALAALALGRRVPSVLLTSIAALCQIPIVMSNVTGSPLELYRILHIPAQPDLLRPVAPNTVAAFLPLSVAVLLMNVGGKFRWRSLVVGLLGSVVTALAFTSLTGYAIGVKIFEWGQATPMALSTAIGLLLLGAGVLSFGWREERGSAWAPSWLFLAATLFSALFTVSLSQALLATDRDVTMRAASPDPLPVVVLVTGLLLSALLGAAIFLARQAALRKQASEAMCRAMEKETAERRQAESDLDQFFALSMEMMCIGGADGIFKRVNPAFERILGFSCAERQTEPFLHFVHPEDRERTLAALQQLAAGQPLACFENRYRTRDGSIRWMQWVCAPVPERQLFFASARDVTETKDAQEALQRAHDELEDRVRERTATLERTNQALASSEAQIIQLNHQLQEHVAELMAANQELEAFTYSVSHDLRAPLRHVDGFSKILLEDFSQQLPPDAKPLLDRVREGSQRMGRMIDELLQLSRTARREPEKRLTGLRSLVDEVIGDLAAETANRDVEWRVGDLPFVDCDPGLTRQVFVNLLSNALKFSRLRRKAVIEVGETDRQGEKVLFVRDNGVGFSMKYADKLFAPFQRLHRQEDFEGTGVGLATAQRIVRKHGGRIWAEAALDQGATFYFMLEAAAAGSTGKQPTEDLEIMNATK